MNEKIIEGLKTLDAKVDAQWTQDGLVNLNGFKFVIGGEAVTREQLEAVAPGFNRENSETYFLPKTAEPQTNFEKDSDIEDPVKDRSNVVKGEIKLLVEVQFSDALRALLTSARDIEVEELTIEQLKDLMPQVPERRNQLINLREEMLKAIDAEMNQLVNIEAAYDRSVPKDNHADIVKQVYLANASKFQEVDRPRARAAAIVPPLNRR